MRVRSSRRLIIAWMVLGYAATASAIIVRPDRDDRIYRELATKFRPFAGSPTTILAGRATARELLSRHVGCSLRRTLSMAEAMRSAAKLLKPTARLQRGFRSAANRSAFSGSSSTRNTGRQTSRKDNVILHSSNLSSQFAACRPFQFMLRAMR